MNGRKNYNDYNRHHNNYYEQPFEQYIVDSFFLIHRNKKYNNFFDSYKKNHYQNIYKNNKINLNQTLTAISVCVDTILSAVNYENSTQNDVRYLWDVLDPLFRLALLNQTQVKDLGFDVAQELSNNLSSIMWNYLSTDITTFLDNQRENILNLTFAQWNWVDSSNKYANLKLLTFMPNKIVKNFQKIMDYLNLIAFSSKIDITTLKNNLQATSEPSSSNGQYLAQAFLDRFFKLINFNIII